MLTKTSSGWNYNTAVQPTVNFERAVLSAAACSSSQFCLAFGQYFTSQAGWTNWTIRWNGHQWQQLYLSGLERVTIADVACPADQDCTVVGTTWTAGNLATTARLFHYQDATWSQPAEPALAGLGAMNSISCSSTEHCWAAGRTASSTSPYFAMISSNGNQWQSEKGYSWSINGYFTSIDCSLEAVCTLLGVRTDTGDRLIARWANDSWIRYDQTPTTSRGWRAVACQQETCFVAGQSAQLGNDSSMVRGIIDQSTGNVWRSQQVEPAETTASLEASQQGHMPLSSLAGISCQAGICIAYGSYTAGNQQRIYVAEHKGQDWVVLDPLISPPVEALPLPVPAPNLSASSPSSYVTPTLPLAKPLRYVAFGDSLTTGNSIAACRENRQQSPWGCANSPPATPYPDIVAERLGLSFSDQVSDYRSGNQPANLGLYRAGIWGYKLRDAAQTRNQSADQPWMPQFLAVEHANQLVTGALGINDLRFSDVVFWLKKDVTGGSNGVQAAAQQILAARSGDFEQMFKSLSVAKQNGAQVVVGLYYNPYDSAGIQCRPLKQLADQLVNSLDQELVRRSKQAGFKVADFRPAFMGHGAGSQQSYVFGSQCKITSAVTDWLPSWLPGPDEPTLGVGFDPHPNQLGTAAMAEAVIKEVRS
jgi:lysophospholipase L1-like esterase